MAPLFDIHRWLRGVAFRKGCYDRRGVELTGFNPISIFPFYLNRLNEEGWSPLLIHPLLKGILSLEAFHKNSTQVGSKNWRDKKSLFGGAKWRKLLARQNQKLQNDSATAQNDVKCPNDAKMPKMLLKWLTLSSHDLCDVLWRGHRNAFRHVLTPTAFEIFEAAASDPASVEQKVSHSSAKGEVRCSEGWGLMPG